MSASSGSRNTPSSSRTVSTSGFSTIRSSVSSTKLSSKSSSSSLSTTTASSSLSASLSKTSSTHSHQDNGVLPTGTASGQSTSSNSANKSTVPIVIGVAAAVGAILALIIAYRCWKRRKSKFNPSTGEYLSPVAPPPPSLLNTTYGLSRNRAVSSPMTGPASIIARRSPSLQSFPILPGPFTNEYGSPHTHPASRTPPNYSAPVSPSESMTGLSTFPFNPNGQQLSHSPSSSNSLDDNIVNSTSFPRLPYGNPAGSTNSGKHNSTGKRASLAPSFNYVPDDFGPMENTNRSGSRSSISSSLRSSQNARRLSQPNMIRGAPHLAHNRSIIVPQSPPILFPDGSMARIN